MNASAAPRPLKAYVVQNEYDGEGGIVFARHAIVARRNGASEFGDGDFYGLTCRRAPWADAYAPGPVPPLVMIDNGWWFECWGCGVRIDSDCYDEESDRKLEPVESGQAIYCTAECRESHLADRAEAKRVQNEAIEALRAELLRRLPGVEIVDDPERPHHAYATAVDGKYVAKQAVIYFTFPGCEIGKATFRFDEIGEEPHLGVCNGDLAAWNAWREQVGASAKVPA